MAATGMMLSSKQRSTIDASSFEIQQQNTTTAFDELSHTQSPASSSITEVEHLPLSYEILNICDKYGRQVDPNNLSSNLFFGTGLDPRSVDWEVQISLPFIPSCARGATSTADAAGFPVQERMFEQFPMDDLFGSVDPQARIMANFGICS